MNAADRVAITGIGAVSALGIGFAALRDGLLAGRSGIRPLADVDSARLVARHAGRVPDFAPPSGADSLDRHVQMALAAAAEALADSGLARSGRRVALVFATCAGPLATLETRTAPATPRADDDPEADPDGRIHGGALTLARRLRLGGPVTTVATACAASAGAVARAADLLRTGRCDAVLAGGADAFSLAALAGFDRLRTTSPSPCAPFSIPPGMTLGEGAGFWVLEPESVARGRNARIHGFVLGHALSNDAHHPTTPNPTGAGIRRALADALADAGVASADIGHVNAHGSGTLANDRTECRAVARAFDDAPPPVTSTKAALGHALGAAGILEATASLLAVVQGLLPPTLHFTRPREGCALDCVPNVARPAVPARFVSQSLAFHGHNAVLVLAPPDDPPAPGPLAAPDDVVLVAVARTAAAPDREDAPRERGESPRGVDGAAALAAPIARAALAAARVPDRAADRACVGLVLGQCDPPSEAERRLLDGWRAAGPDARDLAAFPFAVPNAVAGTVARLLGLKAWSTSLCAGHGAGLDALACATDAARLGHADRIAAGAADAPADAAAFVVVERARSAAARDVPALARVAAWDAALVPPGTVDEIADAVADLLDRALRAAAVPPADVGACCLSDDAPGGPLATAIARVLPVPAIRNAVRPPRGARPAHGAAPLLALADLLATGPIATPAVVASLSRHGEARVVVLVPAALSREVHHA